MAGEARCAVNDGSHKGWRPPDSIKWGKCYACGTRELLRTEHDDLTGENYHVHAVTMPAPRKVNLR